ncbi:hypothetical protein M426DRAFT_103822 [Hypoxylon sp. CI-4A]|nr:hypothetical protein M426DRAFT_103822 [Hypoxylon sp. CI-4A]
MATQPIQEVSTGAPASETTNNEYASKIRDSLTTIGIQSGDILSLLNHGLSDFWIPMKQNSYPRILGPSQYDQFTNVQRQLVVSNFLIQPPSQWPGEHFSLSTKGINHQTLMPTSLQYVEAISHPQNNTLTDVTKMKQCGLGSNAPSYALKRIRRQHGVDYSAQMEQMNYIKGELSILRKLLDTPRRRHFVKLVASYTEEDYVGMVMSPVADCNLGKFLDDFHANGNRNPLLLQGFFGCLAWALARLHYAEKIRHKDIKPENILIKDNNVLFTDFGISLDWSATGQTTTQQEKSRTSTYCSPEFDDERPRNSKADIWSLGCVFLEMFAVLKGKSRSYVRDILTEYGSPRFCRSLGGIEKLINELGADGSPNNIPLTWIRDMLQRDSTLRPTAMELKDAINGADGYCAICCRGVDVFDGGAPAIQS